MLHAAHTLKAGKAGSSDGLNFQALSSPRPEVKRFTLRSRKAVAIALTELGPVTKKALDLAVTIVTSKNYAHSPFPRYFPAARQPRGPEIPPLREPALSLRGVIGRLSPSSSCGRNPTLIFFSFIETRQDVFFKYFYKSAVAVSPRGNIVSLFFFT